MPIQLLMPALSPTMTEGTLAKWHKKEGDTVESGDVIAEIETDKATMEFEAVDEGTLGKILVPEGTAGVAVNQPIALLLEEGEDPSALEEAAQQAEAAPAPAAPTAAPAAAPKPTPTAQPSQPAAPERPAAPPPPRHPSEERERVFASPLARRLAKEAGIELARITGSGPRGRIVKADVERAKAEGVPAAPKPEAAPAEAPAAAPAAGPVTPAIPPELLPPFEEVPNTTFRKTVARRMVEAKQAPHFYLTIDCEIDRLLELRKELNAKAGEGEYKLSVNDMIIKAAALALKKVPAANASWSEQAIRRYTRQDISVAVATPNGLITPVIRDAGNKGLAAISNEMRDLATRARDGKLKPEEYTGGGFSVSNLGMYGIKEFSAVINPPQGCILAVGAGEQRPVVKDGALAIATMMSCTLSVDHRVVDGAVGAEYLAAFKEIVQEPLRMLL